MPLKFELVNSGASAPPRGRRSGVEFTQNVQDNLEAAATPITTEPVAGQVPYRRDLRQEQIDRLVAAGDDVGTATMVVDRLREIHGDEIPMALFDHYNNPQDNEALRQRITESKVANARMDAFERNYNAETGHPEYGYDEAGNAAKLGRVNIDNRSTGELREAGARRYQHRAPYNAEMEAANHGPGSDYVSSAEVEPFVDATVPGPRTLDGKSPTPSRGLTAEEAEAYNTRKPGQLSQADQDMAARGLVPVVTPDGVRYMASAATGGEGDGPLFPGGPGRAGDGRQDLVDKGWVPVEKRGPDGRKVMVYEPGPKMRAKQAEDLKGRQADYAAKKARMDSEREAARQSWRATAFLAGGSQNLNSGNRWIANNLVRMKPEDRDESLRYMLPGGELAAKVDAAHNEQLSELGLRVAMGRGFQNLSPEQQAAQQVQNQAAQSQQSAGIQAEAERLVGERADDKGWFNLLTRVVGGGVDGWDNTLMTIAEEEEAIKKLMAKYPHLTYDEARQHVDAAASGTTRQQRPATK